MKKLIPCVAIAALFLSACSTKSTTIASAADSVAMKTAKNKEAALNSNLAFIKGDVDAAFKDYSSDFVDYGDGSSKPMKNIDSMKMNNKAFLAAFPDLKVENMHAVGSGDTVIVTGTWSGTFKKEYMKIKPTNKSYKVPDADIFTFNKDGKITSHSNIQSLATYFYQLDIPMPAKKK
jgi:predicted ester cyclase